MHLRSLEHKQDGTMVMLNHAREAVDRYMKERPTSCRVAVHGLRAYRSGAQAITVDAERQAAATSGLFKEFLRLMQLCPKSCKLQCVGVDCFFHLMGGFSVFSSVPHPQSGRKTVGGVSEPTKAVMIGTLESLVTEGGEGGMKILVAAISTIINCYNLEMGPIEKKYILYMSMQSSLHLSLSPSLFPIVPLPLSIPIPHCPSPSLHLYPLISLSSSPLSLSPSLFLSLSISTLLSLSSSFSLLSPSLPPSVPLPPPISLAETVCMPSGMASSFWPVSSRTANSSSAWSGGESPPSSQTPGQSSPSLRQRKRCVAASSTAPPSVPA